MPRKRNTRAAQGSGTIRQRPDGTWEARYVVGHDPGDWKQIRRSVYAKTQQEVRQKLAQAIAALDNSEYFEPEKMPLTKWLDIWLDEYTSDKKYLTVKHYRAQVETHIKPALGAMRLSQIKPHDIQKFYNNLLSSGQSVPKRDKDGKIEKNKAGKTIYESAPMAPKSVRNIHGVLTKALSTAVDIGYLKVNPADRVTLPRVEKSQVKPLTDKQVKDYIQEAAKDEHGDLLTVILFTGLRESEALGLTWDCVDFDNRELTINKQLQKRPLSDGGFRFASLKNDKARILRVAPFVMELLHKVKQRQTENKLRAGMMWNEWRDHDKRYSSCKLVFTNAIGEHIHPQRLYDHHKKIAKAIGAPDARVHDLRHTFAVLSLQNGDDIKTVQGNLGHATAAFTLDVYGHVSEKMKDDSAARMEKYISNL
ncbi:MAG: site-specific integrase [Oscillospiraceae bacterium]|nr:site-specific integrase [Oscillospiraceae bacterium]